MTLATVLSAALFFGVVGTWAWSYWNFGSIYVTTSATAVHAYEGGSPVGWDTRRDRWVGGMTVNGWFAMGRGEEYTGQPFKRVTRISDDDTAEAGATLDRLRTGTAMWSLWPPGVPGVYVVPVDIVHFNGRPTHWLIVAAGWPAVMTAALPAWSAVGWWRRRRRGHAGRCRRCGYDLRASPGRCPECGAAVVAERPLF